MEQLLYENPMATAEDVKDFTLEGAARISFENGRMRMQNTLSPSEGQKANFVQWCDRIFPDNIRITWGFSPIEEPGLSMLFFAAKGRNGEDIFHESLNCREGEYQQYNSGDINAFHVSYFRRKELIEREFHVCNLRKSYGAHLVMQGADPIPDVPDCKASYTLTVIKKTDLVKFYVDDLLCFTFHDDGETYGDHLTEGRIGFRQLAPMIGEYWNLKVYAL